MLKRVVSFTLINLRFVDASEILKSSKQQMKTRGIFMDIVPDYSMKTHAGN